MSKAKASRPRPQHTPKPDERTLRAQTAAQLDDLAAALELAGTPNQGVRRIADNIRKHKREQVGDEPSGADPIVQWSALTELYLSFSVRPRFKERSPSVYVERDVPSRCEVDPSYQSAVITARRLVYMLAEEEDVSAERDISKRLRDAAEVIRRECHQVSVDVQNNAITLDGTPYRVEQDVAHIVDKLVKASGGWVTFPGRIDRIINAPKKLPVPIRKLIQAQPGKGYRLLT